MKEGAGSGVWCVRTSDPSPDYGLDHQLRVRLSLTSASVTPEGQIHHGRGQHGCDNHVSI